MEEEKFNKKEIIWIFIYGCVFGFIIETLFYIIKYGEYVNKQGLLYGPFKPIYGFGALLSTVIYYLVKKKTNIRFFLVGTLIGSVFEYFSSWIIELIYHSYIWDYSDFKYNINGRIYLPYCFVWGAITLLWARLLYPFFKRIFNKFKDMKYFNLVTIIATVFMVSNFLITQVVLIKETTNNKNTKFYKIVEKYYPHDEVVKKFPKFRSLD